MRRQPRSTLFPYTTLFRSGIDQFTVIIHLRLPVAEWKRQQVITCCLCFTDHAGKELIENMIDLVGRGLHPRITNHVAALRSEEHTSELQSQSNLVCRLLLE